MNMYFKIEAVPCRTLRILTENVVSPECPCRVSVVPVQHRSICSVDFGYRSLKIEFFHPGTGDFFTLLLGAGLMLELTGQENRFVRLQIHSGDTICIIPPNQLQVVCSLKLSVHFKWGIETELSTFLQHSPVVIKF